MKKKPEDTPQAEPENVVVTVLQPRTLIRKAICGQGRCSFLLTATEAKALEALGKIRIEGIR
jgi:hypothetical protein